MAINKALVVKHSPFILIWTFAAIEILGFICYAIAAALGNYKYELYTQLSFSTILSYQIAKLVFLFAAELVMIVYAFLHWHLETYTIQPGAISHQWGIFFKKKKTIPLGRDMSVMLSSGPLGKLFGYGTIRIQNADSQPVLVLSDISRPQRYMKVIEKNLEAGGLAHDNSPNILKLLVQDEHEQLEFKSSLRFDFRSSQVNHDLEKSVMKTVAGFLNSKGGNLVIGVDDSRQPLGLKHDYQTLKRVNSDGFENHFTQVFNVMIGPEFRHLIYLRFPVVDDRELCIIHVLPSARPIYLKLDDNEHFYVRTGNGTTPLKMSEAESYIRSRRNIRV